MGRRTAGRFDPVMRNKRRLLAFPIGVCLSAFPAASARAGEPPSLEGLGSSDPAVRARTAQGVAEELSRLSSAEDEAGLAPLLASLRRLRRTGDLETRSRVEELLAPFSAGALLWRCQDVPGIVCAVAVEGQALRAAVNGKPSRAGSIDLATGEAAWVEQPLTWGMCAADFSDGKVVAGGYLQTDPDKLKGWMTAMGADGGVSWTRTADEMPGVRFLKVLPEGILAGGAAAILTKKIEENGKGVAAYDPEGWVGLFDPATGKPLWLVEPGTLAANNVSILPVGDAVLVAGLDTKGKAAWVHRCDLATGKRGWAFTDLPAKATAVDPAGPGRACLRQAAGWVGMLDIGYDGSKEPKLLWGNAIGKSVRATAVDGESLFVAGFDEDGKFLRALDPATGREAWAAHDFPGNIWALAAASGTVCAAGGADGGGWVSVHDGRTGDLLWSAKTRQPVQHLRIAGDRLVTAGGREAACWRLSENPPDER